MPESILWCYSCWQLPRGGSPIDQHRHWLQHQPWHRHQTDRGPAAPVPRRPGRCLRHGSAAAHRAGTFSRPSLTPALPPGRTQKSPATVAEESRPEPWRCPAVPAKERVQPPAPLAPGEEQRLSALHRQAGSRDPPAHGQPGSPRSCRRDRPLLTWNTQGLFSGF